VPELALPRHVTLLVRSRREGQIRHGSITVMSSAAMPQIKRGANKVATAVMTVRRTFAPSDRHNALGSRHVTGIGQAIALPHWLELRERLI
jgi:hypothetical protein